MGDSLSIRPLVEADRAQWEPLWQGYLTFYKARLTDAVTETTWHRLLDPAEPVHALVAESGGRLVGLTHYLFHRSTWAPQCYCYLEDLFVAPAARGGGVGRLLIGAVDQRAREAGATRLYWSTHESNVDAQQLYDKLAERSGFIQYRKRLN